jgi:hypothetical protein
MVQNIVDKVKGFIIDPEESFRQSSADDLGEALMYFAVLLAINAVLSGIISMALGTVTTGIVTVIFDFISWIIGLFVTGIVVHIFVVLFIGGKGIEQTFKVMMYGATPALLLGWIPLVSIIAGLWSLVLYILGIRELHETTTGKAAAAVIVPFVLLLVAVTIILAAFVAFFALSTGAVF